jgi:hypothetical protein
MQAGGRFAEGSPLVAGGGLESAQSLSPFSLPDKDAAEAQQGHPLKARAWLTLAPSEPRRMTRSRDLVRAAQ